MHLYFTKQRPQHASGIRRFWPWLYIGCVFSILLVVSNRAAQADVLLQGDMHIGDTAGIFAPVTPLQPDMMTRYPSRFEINAPLNITAVRFNGLSFQSKNGRGKLNVYIDGTLIGTSPNNSNVLTLKTPLPLTAAVHTFHVVPDCLNTNGNSGNNTGNNNGNNGNGGGSNVSCNSQQASEYNDVTFSSVTLLSTIVNASVNINRRYHIGAIDDANDFYDRAKNQAPNLYPDPTDGMAITQSFTVPQAIILNKITIYGVREGYYTAQVFIDNIPVGSINQDGTVVFTSALPLTAGTHTLRIAEQNISAWWIQFLSWFGIYVDLSWDDVILSATPSVGLSAFDIKHDGNGINCQPEAITITPVNSAGNPVPFFIGQITLSTSTRHGDWSTINANGTLNNGAADDGQASYNFVLADNGQIVLGLRDIHAEALTITVSYLGVTSTSATLTFRPYGFKVTPDPMGTQVADKPFSFQLHAVGNPATATGCTPITEYSGTKTLDFWSTYTDPATNPYGSQVAINGANVGTSEAGATAQAITFNQGVSNAITANYPDAGQIQISMKDPTGIGTPGSGGSQAVIGGSAFVVRPFGFNVDFSGDRAANGTGGVSYAADQNGSVFKKAGEAFTSTVSAVVWQAADDTNNDGIPDAGANLADNAVTRNFGREATPVTPASVPLTHTLVAPAGGSAGTLTTNSRDANFVNGAANYNLSWSEVGIIDLSANLGNYLAGGQGVTGTVTNVGRFYPDHLCASAPALTNRTDPNTQAGCSANFSYLDELFTSAVTLRAQPLGASCSSATVTQNYTGVWSKFSTPFSDNYTVANESGKWNYAAVNDPTGSPLDLSSRLANDPSNCTPANGQFTNGTISLSCRFKVLRQGSAPAYTPEAPLTAAHLGIHPVDTDGVGLLAADLNLNIGTDKYYDVGTTTLYFGRLFAENAYGSEQQPLAMWARTQYCASASGGACTAWTNNDTDSCSLYSVLPPSGTVLGNAAANDGEGYYFRPATGGYDYTGSSTALANVYLPDSQQHAAGWQVWYTAGGNGGNYLIPFANHPYLITQPGTASFGQYRGDDRIIYWRENNQ